MFQVQLETYPMSQFQPSMFQVLLATYILILSQSLHLFCLNYMSQVQLETYLFILLFSILT